MGYWKHILYTIILKIIDSNNWHILDSKNLNIQLSLIAVTCTDKSKCFTNDLIKDT